ncbi:MAG: N-acetylmuramoyl-L-alanine amidase [Coriobacteriales bacterium]|nr:N-acetylmuramoyl-L-alanine amidase [Coriobacteriales bacterium]
MYRDRDNPSLKHFAIWLAAIAALVVLLLAAGGWAIDAFLSKPALEPPVAASTPTGSLPSSPAATGPAQTAEATLSPPPTLDSETAEKKAALTPKPKASTKKSSSSGGSLGVVVIDPGHQANGDSSTEPIGPGASQRKPKVTTGASGVSTGQTESSLNLKVSLRLRDELKSRGVKVIMVRTKQGVNIANSERAAVANRNHADLFIRIHADSIDSRSRSGLSTLVPAKNQWTGPIVKKSTQAGRDVHNAVIAATGATDRGIVPRSDMSGFNWSKRPCLIVEMGFLSNPAEDRKLATSSYQNKIADGLADGVVKYLKR